MSQIPVYFSIGLEILEVVPEPDIVVVCCGGGGLVAGIATAVKLSGCTNCKIYAVEPIGGMYDICDKASKFDIK